MGGKATDWENVEKVLHEKEEAFKAGNDHEEWKRKWVSVTKHPKGSFLD